MAIEKHLNVAHIWQLDPDSPIPEDQRRSMCAPASVNMVLDFVFVKHGEYSFRLDKLASEMENFGGRVAGVGWKHSAQVDTFKHHGLIAWRRNWLAPSQDPSYFTDHEGYNDGQVEAFIWQLTHEKSVSDSMQEQALCSIKASIDDGYPVIISVKAGFSENEIGHMVVVSGYTDNTLEIVDPLLPPGEQKVVEMDYFWEYFKLQAIFVLPVTK